MAKVKSFTASVGVSLEINNVWYKFHTGIEVEPDENEDIAEVKKKAWNTCHVELEKQIEDVK